MLCSLVLLSPIVLFLIASCGCVQEALAFLSPTQLHKIVIDKSFRSSTLFERHKIDAGIKTLLHAHQGETDKEGKQQDIAFLEKSKRQGRKKSGRTGGRRRKRIMTLPSKKKNKSSGGILQSSWFRAGVPLVAILFLLKTLFGSLFGNGSDYVYYQSSVYESRVYTPDGRVETARKESVQSNIPSLMDGKQLRDSSSQYLLRDSPDRDFDRELDTMTKQFQQSIFDKFF